MRMPMIVAAGLLAFATEALALEPKQCLPIAEINAALKVEGQRTLIIGDRRTINSATGSLKDAVFGSFVNTVTSNADGSFGYRVGRR